MKKLLLSLIAVILLSVAVYAIECYTCNDAGVVQCSSCQGLGYLGACYTCDGIGSLQKKCYNCSGQGYSYGKKCLTCFGAGFKQVRCYRCNGSGNGDKCYDCKGRGVKACYCRMFKKTS